MQRYKITIEYDGTNYYGWQKQSEDITIQKEIEKALYQFSQEHALVYGMGRTDSGVHALEQVAHFDLNKDYLEEQVVLGINYFLKGQQIAVTSCTKVSPDFHARYSAKKRIYQYIILNRLAQPALDLNRACYIRPKLDIGKIKEAIPVLVGTHDFTSFRTKLCQAKSPIKTLEYINIIQKDEKIIFELCAQSFLHHMVRNIIGTLVLVGLDKMTKRELEDYLNAKDINCVKHTANACGLYFVKAIY
jgi:tRNA pseudouridine38-40 synthase